MRIRRSFAATAVTAVLVVPVAVLGGPALARSVQSSAAQYQYGTTKVTICHHTGSRKHPWVRITISMAGWLNGHVKHHGDFVLGAGLACPNPGPAAANTTTTTKHGNDDDQGENGNNGNHGHHGKP